MAYLGWFDGELRPDAWWDAELQPAGWWDTEIIDTSTGGGGPATYNETLSESVATAATLTTIATLLNSIAEFVAAADTYVSNVTFPNTLATESIAMGDSVAAAATFANAMTESVTPADTDSSVQTFVATLSESTTLLDDYAGTVAGGSVTYNETLAESLALADLLISNQVMENALAEAVAMGFVDDATATYANAFTETITLADGATTTVILANNLAEASAVVVSPCTSKTSGWCSLSTSRMPSSTDAVTSNKSCPGFIRLRSMSGVISKTFKT